MTASVRDSIDALTHIDPRALQLSELKDALRGCARARSRVDAVELRLIAEFKARAGCVSDGMVNTRAWLAHHTGVARNIAGSRVKLATNLRQMPMMETALAEGAVTTEHARQLSRCLKPRLVVAYRRDEPTLVDTARRLETDDFEKVVTRWLQLNDTDGTDPGDVRPSELHVSPMMAGRHRLDGELDLDDSVDFLAELETIYNELWLQDQAADESDPNKHRAASQRYAAALAEMARRSSSAGDRDDDSDDEVAAVRPADSAAKKGPKGRPRMPKFIVRVDVPGMHGDPAGTAELEDGTVVPTRTSSEWLCDCSIARVVMDGASMPIDLGSETYSPSPAQRRALIARDGGCMVPGCRRKARWCHAHHVISWPTGPTNLKNLVLLCKRHHKDVHRKQIYIVAADQPGTFIVTRPDGTRLYERPPPTRQMA